MNNKRFNQSQFNGPKNMKRILPKIFGLGILAGVGALLLGLIAKLLITVSLLGLIVTRIAKGIRRRHAMANGGMAQMTGNTASAYQNPGAAFSRAGSQSTIVPVY